MEAPVSTDPPLQTITRRPLFQQRAWAAEGRPGQVHMCTGDHPHTSLPHREQTLRPGPPGMLTQTCQQGAKFRIIFHSTSAQQQLPRRPVHLEPDMKQRTGSLLGKEYVKAVYCHPAYLTNMPSTLCKMLGWLKHKPESRLPGLISIISAMQMTPPLWQKANGN